MYVLLTSVVYEVEPAEQILKSTFYKTRWQHFSALDALLHKHIAAREGGGSFAIQSQVEDSGNTMLLNAKDIIPRPAGGGGGGDIWTLPVVFREHLKNGGCFWHTLSCIFSAHVKIVDQGHLRSGHQVTSSDLTSYKVSTSSICYIERPTSLKLSAIDKGNNMYTI